MELERYRRLILKHWTVVLACVLFTGIGAALATQLMTKIYVAQVRVQVDFPATDPAVVLGVNQLIATEVQEATSQPVLSAVAAKYPDLTYQSLHAEVTAAAFTGSQLFIITVLDPSPTRAARLANDIAGALIAQQKQVLAADNAQARQLVMQTIADTSAQIAAAQVDLTTKQAKSAESATIIAAEEKLQALGQQYAQLQLTLKEILVAQASKSSFMHVADPAIPNYTAKRPYLLLNVGIGLAVGVVLGLLVIALLDLLDQRVRSVRDVLDVFAWPVLAEVHATQGLSVIPAGADYQELVTSLAYLNVEQPVRSLTVLSAVPDESARDVAAGLALMSAERGQRTLLVDADLAHPSLAERFGIQVSTGVSTALLASNATPDGSIPIDPYIFPPATVRAPMLRVMPAGPKPPNPSGMLKSRAGRSLVGAIAASGADVAIFSAPPPLRASGAVALAQSTGAALVVVELARARKDQLLRTRSLLDEAGVRVLGCVLRSATRTSRKAKVVTAPAERAFTPQPGVAATTRAPTGVPQPGR